jgi:hypothetical protein
LERFIARTYFFKLMYTCKRHRHTRLWKS